MKIQNERTIIYVSGWLGNGKDSATYHFLEKYFTNLDCYASGGETNPEIIINDLRELINKYNNPLIIANSYGCFGVSLCGYEAIMINPCLYPSKTLPNIAELSGDQIETFKQYEINRDINKNDNPKYTCVCSTEDEIIPDHMLDVSDCKEIILVLYGKHKLTNAQRKEFVLPAIYKELEG